MSTKSDVVKILEVNRGKSVSGEEIAKSLNISRTAVWKAMEELRASGYEIKAVPNKGYCLSNTSDVLSAEAIKLFLNNKNSNVFVYESIGSTNQKAKQLAAESMLFDSGEACAVIAANQQTAGRGRMGRSFFSPPNSGIYFSIAVSVVSQTPALITISAAVAVCRTIKKYTGISCGIKWVNDIIVNGKKICGILSEAITNLESYAIDCVIVGIGINCTTNTFPDELQKKAGNLNYDGHIVRNKLIAEVTNEFIEILNSGQNEDLISEYKRMSVVIGKNIQIIEQTQDRATRHIPAKAVDIDQNGGLVVETMDCVRTLTFGEISIDGDFYS